MISTPSGPHTTLEILILFEMYEYYVTRCENKDHLNVITWRLVASCEYTENVMNSTSTDVLEINFNLKCMYS